jgi:transposase
VCLDESVLFSFLSIHRLLVHLMGIRDELKKKIVSLASKERYKLSVEILESFPGLSVLSATRLILEWDDVRRFRRKSMFAQFLGLVPGEYSSGERERKGHITKQGNRWVRRWLIQASWVGIRKDPVMLDFFERIRSHSGSAKKAIVAVARKYAIRMRALLLLNEPYMIGVVE